MLGLIADGLSNIGICERLVLGRKTVETHVNSIFGKLGLHPTPHAQRRVLAALEYLGS